MFTAAFVACALPVLVVFVFFLAEELDTRRRNDEAVGPWVPVFIPLVLFIMFIVAHSVWHIVASLPSRRPPRVVTGDDDDDIAVQTSSIVRGRSYRAVIGDAVIDLLLCGLAFFFVFAVIAALSRSDHPEEPRPWASFIVAEVAFYSIFVALGWLAVIGAVRTFSEYQNEGVAPCWLTSLTCCIPFFKHLRANAIGAVEDNRIDRNTRTPIAILERYTRRQPYQNNKLVYGLAFGALPNAWIDGIHVVLLAFHWIAMVVTGAIVFARLRQIATVDAALRESVTIDGVMDDASIIEKVRGGVWHSLKDWRGLVTPLAVAFTPLFVTQGMLLAYSVPQAVYYFVSRRSLSEWLQGVAYAIFFALVITFEALLSARVDVGVMDHLSWHNTFAPLYTALLAVEVLLVASILLRRPMLGNSSGSQWGVVVD